MVDGLYPKDYAEAVQMKTTYKEATLYAGGTDWMVRHRPCEKLLFLNQIPELKEIYEDEEAIYVGSGCTYAELLEHALVPELLKKAVRGIAAPAIRNIGTIGGNVCNASPAGDTLPVLYALEAKLKVTSVEKEIILPLEAFIVGVRQLTLTDTQILKQIILPKQNFTHEAYQKVGARKSQALSKLSFVGLANIKDGILVDLRISFGSVSTKVVKVKEIEALYLGGQIKDLEMLTQEILEKYEAYIKPIDDQRSTASYRKKVSLNLLEAFLKSLC